MLDYRLTCFAINKDPQMDRCKEKLHQLAAHDSAFAQAVDNLLRDLHDPDSNPFGNIQATLAEALDGACVPCEATEAAQLLATLHSHCSTRQPTLSRAAPCPGWPLRRVCSATTFAL